MVSAQVEFIATSDRKKVCSSHLDKESHMRKLASIQTVNAVEPIPRADAIERVRVLGWWVVAKKGEYKRGDKIVYCEIDSLLPERPEFEFLRLSYFVAAQTDAAGAVVVPAGFRIRTVKLRGQVSQGICFPLSILPPDAPTEVGSDVTELLGVRKWELLPPAGMEGKVKGGFPGFLPKTDEVRVQVIEATLQRHPGKFFQMTEKLDGTSLTAFIREGEFGICSRDLWLDETDESSVYARAAKRYDLETKLRYASILLGHDVAIQAELLGPSIQGNKYNLSDLMLYAFNVFDIDGYRYLDHGPALALLQAIDVPSVPQAGTMPVTGFTIDQLVAHSDGPSMVNPKMAREGLVLRPAVEEYDDVIGGRLSFKVINPNFLLKFGE